MVFSNNASNQDSNRNDNSNHQNNKAHKEAMSLLWTLMMIFLSDDKNNPAEAGLFVKWFLFATVDHSNGRIRYTSKSCEQ